MADYFCLWQKVAASNTASGNQENILIWDEDIFLVAGAGFEPAT